MRGLIRRAAAGLAAVAGAGTLAGGMMTVAAGAAGAGAATVTGVEAPLPANAASDPRVGLSSVSCASAGNCTAVGSYHDRSGAFPGLLLTQTAGTWATGVEAPLPANAAPFLGAFVASVSCVSAGNCTAVGAYTTRSGNGQGLLLTQTAGTWTAAEAAPPADAGSNPGAGLFSVSCASAGNCTAVGVYHDRSGHEQGLLLTQTAGTWATGTEAPLPADAASNPFAGPGSVSCASAGNCTAVGGYNGSSPQQGLLLTQTAGTWAAAKAALPAGAGSTLSVSLLSVSCASAGNCTAVGGYVDSSGFFHGLLLTQTAGTWATGVEAPLPAGTGPNPGVTVRSVSCASAGNCTAVAPYRDSSGHQQGLLLTQTAGTWAAAKAALPANARSNTFAFLNSVSCASAGNCTAAGGYLDSSGHFQGLLLTQAAGTWAPGVEAPLPANAGSNPIVELFSVSCALAGSCTAVGQYYDSSGHLQGLLLTQTAAAAPDLSLTDTAPATAVSGQPYRYTLVTTNTGGAAATRVRITDTLPARVHFDAAVTTQGSCTRSPGKPKPKGGTITCAVASLAAGASVTVTIEVTPTKPGTASDAAKVTASNVTADRDDTAAAPVTVHGT